MNSQDLKEYKEKLSKLSEEDKKERDIYLKQLAEGILQGPFVGYSSIDKQWLKNYDENKLKADIPKESMFQMLVDHNLVNMDNVALDMRMSFNNFNKSIKKLTYADFIDETITFACGLRELNIGQESNELLIHMVPNLIESRETIYGCNANGTTVYPISPMIPSSKLEDIIENNNVKTVVVFNGFMDKFRSQLENEKIENIIYIDGLEKFNPLLKSIVKLKDKEGKYKKPNDKRIISWNEIMKNGKKYRIKNNIKSYKDFDSVYDESKPAVVVGTSGTTGVPKGACLSNKAINSMAFINGYFNDFSKGDVNLDALIQSISYGIGIMHLSMTRGLNNIIIPEMVTNKIAMLLKKFKPDHFCGGPIHYENILNSEEFKNGEIPNAKHYLSGGASLSPKTERELNGRINEDYIEPKSGDTKVFVRQGLGSTENVGTGVFSARGAYKFGSVGIPLALTNCSIFKQGTDQELPTGEIGEICMTGPTMMTEYLNNPEETAKVIKKHSDGTYWLHLGDEGYIDSDGHVFMLDRYKNIFMRNGFNVHPSKIKDVLMDSQLLDDCFVMGVDHPVEMSVPVAFVVLKDKERSEEVKQILDSLCFDKLDEYYVPYEYIIVDEIPYNLGGKADAKKLIEDNNVDYSNSKVSKINLR